MSDNDTLFWRSLALFQTLPELQPVQVVDWLAQECGETLTPARLTTLTQPQLAASFPSATAVMSPARWARVIACLQGCCPAICASPAPSANAAAAGRFCSQDGTAINGHFGQSRLFLSMPSMTRGSWLADLRRYASSSAASDASEMRAAAGGLPSAVLSGDWRACRREVDPPSDPSDESAAGHDDSGSVRRGKHDAGRSAAAVAGEAPQPG